MEENEYSLKIVSIELGMSNLSVSRTVLWIRLFRQSFYHMHIKGEVRTHHFKHTTNNSSLCSQQKQRKFSHDDEQCDPVA